MHELSVCQSLLAEVERVAAANGAESVSGIIVAVGPLSGVEASLLSRAFTVARAGTIAADAALDVEEVPVVIWCEACGAETEVAVNALVCGNCGTWRVDLKSGNELILKSIELAVADTPATVE